MEVVGMDGIIAEMLKYGGDVVKWMLLIVQKPMDICLEFQVQKV